ncbi:selina-4(15),7(11)-diene synthase [Streptomyces sp. NPDC021096]|uniref:selina-4(15),7(11)-diene synthase n=1 Tax=Streptomyces sp. NPDC021096 TaxID=3154792 RepID=UPI0033DD46BF
MMTSLPTTLTVPPVYSPFPPRIHAGHVLVQENSTSWAQQWHIGSDALRAHLVQQDIGVFAARVLPEGPQEVVELLAEFILWLFGVDDDICEHGELGRHPGELAAQLSRLLRVAQEPRSPMLDGDPLAVGVRELRGRLAGYATPGQLARWTDGIREYFFSLVWEAHHRSMGSVPGLNDYTLIRLYNGAATAAEPFLEIAGGYELTPREHHHPLVRALAEMAYFIIGWDNDIFSFHKENRGPYYFMNAVQVVRAADGGSLRDALDRVIAQRDRVTAHFLRLRDRHEAELTRRQLRYVGDLGCFIRGNQDWAITSDRYTNPTDPADLPTAFTAVPTDERDEPLPIAVVHAWWQL